VLLQQESAQWLISIHPASTTDSTKMRTPKNATAIFSIFSAISILAICAVNFAFPENEKINYQTTSVIRTEIQEVVLASGTVGARQQVNVGAQVSGQLKSLKVSLGDVVRKGQLIAEIDAKTQQNIVEKARSALAQTRAQLRAKQASVLQIQLKFKREQRLQEHDASSRESYETAQAALSTAMADIDSLKEQVDQAKIAVNTETVNLGYSQIAAPMDGTVVAIVTREGQTVNSTQLAPTIVVLAALDTMTIKAQISEADVTRVKVGQSVHFTTLSDPDRRFTSNLHGVDLAPDSIASDIKGNRSANATPVYYSASFDVPNIDNRLRIAMTVQVSIVLAATKDALVIPVAALGDIGPDGSYQVEVMKVLNGKPVVATRQVRIGIRNVMVEVLEGLKEGEQVVIGKSGGVSTPPLDQAAMHRT
jgi:macrolide-specific efflux system membrane fusion protein